MSEEEKKEPRKVEDEIKETIQANAEVLVKTKAHAGNQIKIIEMKDAPRYNGREGQVTHIDHLGQLHGTRGNFAVIPAEDKYEIILPAEIAVPMEQILKG